MARFSKIQTINAMQATGMVPVFYHNDAGLAKNLVKACYEGGVRASEFPNRGDFAHEVVAAIVSFAANECPGVATAIDSIVDPAIVFLHLPLVSCFIVVHSFTP